MSAVVADYDDSSAEIVRSRKEPVRIAPVAESDLITQSSDRPRSNLGKRASQTAGIETQRGDPPLQEKSDGTAAEKCVNM